MDLSLTLIQERLCAIAEELQILQDAAEQLPEPYRSEVKADLLRLSIN